MSNDPYRRLQEQLEQYSVGFPATKSGVELEILRRLFSEEEGELYLDLSMMLEASEATAARTGRPVEETVELMENMAKKGLLFRHRKGDSVRYAAVPFVVGSYEFQLPHLDAELAALFEKYFEEAFFPNIGGADGVIPLRTVPVNQSIDHSWPVASYDDARKIIADKKKLAVANCICRTQKGLLDDSCEKPVEVCLVFGSHADYYVENNMARRITVEEAYEILDRSEEAGLVNQPFNTVNPEGMCNCCGDCCGVLRALRQHPNPAEVVASNYRVEIDPELCTSCETCHDRCQMDALSEGSEEVTVVELSRCIGCGLCVTTCPTEAITLVAKPEGDRKVPPATAVELYFEMARRRGTSLAPLKTLKR